MMLVTKFHLFLIRFILNKVMPVNCSCRPSPLKLLLISFSSHQVYHLERISIDVVHY